MHRQVKQKRSQDKINKILEATDEVIEKHPKKLSTNFLAKVSGVSIGTIYHYFKNKDEIIYSLYEKSNLKTDSLLLNEEKQDVCWDEKVRNLIPKLVDHFYRYKKHYKFFNKTVAKLDAYYLLTSSRKKTCRKVAEFLEKEVCVPSEDCEKAAYVIVNSFLGCIHNHMLEGEKSVIGKDELKNELTNSTLVLIQSYQRASSLS